MTLSCSPTFQYRVVWQLSKLQQLKSKAPERGRKWSSSLDCQTNQYKRAFFLLLLFVNRTHSCLIRATIISCTVVKWRRTDRWQNKGRCLRFIGIFFFPSFGSTLVHRVTPTAALCSTGAQLMQGSSSFSSSSSSCSTSLVKPAKQLWEDVTVITNHVVNSQQWSLMCDVSVCGWVLWEVVRWSAVCLSRE